MRPEIGKPCLLVYVECMCGQWGTIPEAGILPVCGQCGRRMAPGGGDADMFGPEDDPYFGRRHRGLAFVAMLTNETGAVRLVSKFRDWLGLLGGSEQRKTVTLALERYGEQRAGRYFTDREIAARLKASGFSTEPFWTGQAPPWERPYVRPDTDEGEVVRGEWLQPSTSELEPA